MSRENLLVPPAGPLPQELTHVLVSVPGRLRIVRILSRGHCSPPGFWYDQEDNEWVSVLAGRARLEVEERGMVELGPGDQILLAAHQRHRVLWTEPGIDTIWLAVFYR
jgi:cupin 2 domain-containing protein